MAQKKGTIDVTGLSIHDIMNIDVETINKLGEKDLRRLTSRLVSASNKRIRAMEEKGIETPAYKNLGTDVRFTTKVAQGLSAPQRRNKILQEYSRARNFLSLKTSSISGYKAFIKESKERLAEETGLSYEQIDKIDIGKGFEVFHKLQESGMIPSKGSEGSPKFRDYLIKLMVQNPEITERSLMKKLKKFDVKQYEEETTPSEW